MRLSSWFFFLILIGVVPRLGLATYTESISGISQEEFWPAARLVLKEYGIHKENIKKRSIETQWQYDRVKRTSGLLRHALKQQYNRRYRIRVTTEEGEEGLQIQVKGNFHIRSDSGPSIPWKKAKTSPADQQIEREVFFKILSQIQKTKKQVPIPAST